MKKIDYCEIDRDIWNEAVDSDSYGWLLQRSEFLEAWSVCQERSGEVDFPPNLMQEKICVVHKTGRGFS